MFARMILMSGVSHVGCERQRATGSHPPGAGGKIAKGQ
jgi:hypothetical protein